MGAEVSLYLHAASRLCMAAFALAVAMPAAAQGEDVLQKLVIVSRHGVRTPLPASAELANWAREPWPQWNQPAGALTPRGAQLASLMGRWYRDYAGVLGALPAAGCPAPGAVYAYADVPERTQATARALLDGFAAHCNLAFRTRGNVPVDPLFHPLEAGVCKLDPMLAQTRVLERAGGDLNRITRDLKPQFAALQGVLDCCKPALCIAFGRGEQCTLPDLPTALTTTQEGAGIALVGALPIASAAAEILLLEYADGMPTANVGWGRTTPAQMRDAARLHTEQYDLMQRTPYLARRMGSALLWKVAAAVTSTRALGYGPVDPAVRDAKLVAYVGHDTNIWNLAGMLDVSWLQPGYQRNQTPPAGALMFEVRETPDRKLKVYTSYVAQTPDQMRNATVLGPDAQPARTPLRLPGCGSADPGFPCTIEEFAVTVRNALDRDCLE
jgi:4-phytase / acid phosphatase